MGKIGLWKRIKTSDTERYGLKMSKFDRVMGWFYLLIMVGGLVGYFMDSSPERLVWICVASLGVIFYSIGLVGLLTKRVRELGGDIFYPEKKESK
jgi:uncharacterized protein YybS (DUF2232 family)